MIRVYNSADWMVVDTFRRVLESYGIASDARRESASGTRGKKATTGLWVLDDAKADRARNIIAQAEKRGPRSATRWHCGKCRELNEVLYGQCWHCGAGRSA